MNKKTKRAATILAAVVAFMAGLSARAEEPQELEQEVDTEQPLGIDAELGYASAYVFRGFNVFQENGQMDQHMLIAPGISWSIFDTGLTVGYWGAFQISGGNKNIRDNIDGGLGAEQDLYLTYEFAITDALTAGAGVFYYFYPGADEDLTGASVPMYLEPGANVSYSTVLDLGLNVSYFLGLQDEPGIRGISYLYINPTVGKSFELGSRVGLDVSAGYGFKLFKEGNDGAGNVHDVLLEIGVPISLNESFALSPKVSSSWTNIEGAEDKFQDGIIVWGSLVLQMTL